MIKLSERLLTIANYISDEEDIADIGTDHGYLPLYLIEQNKKRKVIFTDVNDGPLKKAENIIQREHPELPISTLDIRKGDGLKPISANEVDTITIAGMGGILIKDILAADVGKTKSFNKLILQPRTASDKLRRWLVENKIHIVDEVLAYEKGRICEILIIEPQVEASNDEFIDDLDYEFSPILIRKRTHIVSECMNRYLRTEEEIKRNIETGGNEDSIKKLTKIEKRIEYLKKIIEKRSNYVG